MWGHAVVTGFVYRSQKEKLDNNDKNDKNEKNDNDDINDNDDNNDINDINDINANLANNHSLLYSSLIIILQTRSWKMRDSATGESLLMMEKMYQWPSFPTR